MKQTSVTRLTILALGALLGCATMSRAPQPIWFPAKVVRVSEEYANINTDLTQSQLAEHGIIHGTRFDIKFGEHRIVALLGKKYTDVPRGNWIALIEEDGRLQIAVSYGHAATQITCKEGDVLYIESRSRTR